MRITSIHPSLTLYLTLTLIQMQAPILIRPLILMSIWMMILTPLPLFFLASLDTADNFHEC